MHLQSSRFWVIINVQLKGVPSHSYKTHTIEGNFFKNNKRTGPNKHTGGDTIVNFAINFVLFITKPLRKIARKTSFSKK